MCAFERIEECYLWCRSACLRQGGRLAGPSGLRTCLLCCLLRKGTLRGALSATENTAVVVLAQEHREALAPVLVSMLAAAGEACPPGAAAGLPGARVEGVPAAVLAKEAVYAAAAAAAYDLHDYIDFGPWFRGALLQVPLPQPSNLQSPLWCFSETLPCELRCWCVV